MQKFSILPFRQSGFRRGYSFVTALLDVFDDILRNIDVSNVSALLLLDFSKAFDRINHELLLSILG